LWQNDKNETGQSRRQKATTAMSGESMQADKVPSFLRSVLLAALDKQTIPRAAIPNCTNHFSVVNTLRESGFDSACSIEGFQLFGITGTV
jgi:hypothetical protein